MRARTRTLPRFPGVNVGTVPGKSKPAPLSVKNSYLYLSVV